MKYILKNISNEDKYLIYSIKKNSIISYVEKIWGWNEEYQIEDFNSSFNLLNFKKIMVDENCIGFKETLEDDNLINITEIHIIPRYHGLGIGSSIISNVIANGNTKNKPITLGCFKGNILANKLYLKLGFKVIDETDTHLCYEYK